VIVGAGSVLNKPLSFPPIYIASKSPRRHALLEQFGIKFTVLDINIPETPDKNETAVEFVKRIAVEKATKGWNSVQRTESMPVLGADTIVVIEDKILGKPSDRAHGIAMLNKLSGKTHKVLTAIAISYEDKCEVRISETDVSFRDLSDKEISAYWDSSDLLDKAGAYAIQGKAAYFISNINGSYFGVMGLPIYELSILLKKTVAK